MNAPGHFDFYTAILFFHILSAIVAFGATFAYPLIDAVTRRVDVRALPTWDEVRRQIGLRIITPAAIVLLGTGIYLAADRWKDAGSGWFTAAGIIVIALLGLGHGVLNPTARKMRDQGRADIEAGTMRNGRLSEAYEALARREMIFGLLATLLVVVALFLMVVKPGA
jgi:uncharacterized membrane protein